MTQGQLVVQSSVCFKAFAYLKLHFIIFLDFSARYQHNCLNLGNLQTDFYCVTQEAVSKRKVTLMTQTKKSTCWSTAKNLFKD